MADLPVIDILGVGCASVDDVLYLSTYPAANTKMPVRSRARHFGGLTATALVAASRLGASCAFAGALGHDELSAAVIAQLEREQVDVSTVYRRADARPVHSTILVGEAGDTRNIFFDLEGVVAADPGWPNDATIRSARTLFIDDVNVDGALAAAKAARAAGVPIVADLEIRASAELVSLVDHLIISIDPAERLTGLREPAEIVGALWQLDRQAVVVTAGERGCWYRGPASDTRHFPAFSVEAIDTTGCGDVFHGAYAAALARDADLRERITFATAAAALKATKPGAQTGAPTLAAVNAFLEERC